MKRKTTSKISSVISECNRARKKAFGSQHCYYFNRIACLLGCFYFTVRLSYCATMRIPYTRSHFGQRTQVSFPLAPNSMRFAPGLFFSIFFVRCLIQFISTCAREQNIKGKRKISSLYCECTAQQTMKMRKQKKHRLFTIKHSRIFLTE